MLQTLFAHCLAVSLAGAAGAALLGSCRQGARLA